MCGLVYIPRCLSYLWRIYYGRECISLEVYVSMVDGFSIDWVVRMSLL